MKQVSPVTPHPPQVITLFRPSLVEKQPQGSILAHIVCHSYRQRIFDPLEFDALTWNPSFVPSRFSPAFLSARHMFLFAQDLLEMALAEEASERFLKAEALSAAEHRGLSADRGRQFEPLTNFSNKPGEKSYGELLESACDGWPSRDHFITAGRLRRPSWAKDWQGIALSTIGKPFLIAHMNLVRNMSAAAIAPSLGMTPSAAQKAIARMNKELPALGLNSLDENCLPRLEFVLMKLRDWGMSRHQAAAYLVNKVLGEDAVQRFAIADLYWRQGKEAEEIAEERGMSRGAVEMRILRLLEEGE